MSWQSKATNNNNNNNVFIYRTIKFTILYAPQIDIMDKTLNKDDIKLHKKKGKEKKYNNIQKEKPYI